MKKIYLVAILIASIAFTVGCKKSSVGLADDTSFDMEAAKKEIETRNAVYVNSMNRQDSISLADCYTESAKFMQPNGESVVGREHIQKLFSLWMRSGSMGKFALENIDFWGDENMLAVENKWTFTAADGKLLDSGKSLELWKKENDTWKIFRDCYNSNLPLPPPPPPAIKK